MNDLTAYHELCKRNPKTSTLLSSDPSFSAYGRIWQGFDLSAVYAWAEMVSIPEKGNAYTASDAMVESLPVIQELAQAVYGGQPFQAGPCRGDNRVLNGIEYHSGSEVSVCVRPCVMFLGKLMDMQGITYDSALAQAFYFPAGTVVQTYETTLHYTPCATEGYFFTVCLLPRGTGEPLPNGPQDILKKRNKWFIAHSENVEKVQAGDYPGLTGRMRRIN